MPYVPEVKCLCISPVVSYKYKEGQNEIQSFAEFWLSAHFVTLYLFLRGQSTMLGDGKHYLYALFNDASETLQEQVCCCSPSGKTYVPQLKSA